MPVSIVNGAQWGDEGKGKIIDALSRSADLIIRYNGGNNAGNTVINKYGKFPLHLVPSGIFSEKANSYIANGVVIDLEVLLKEIEDLEKAGVKLKNKLFISPRCHLILPYHKILEQLYEEAKGKNKVGTTGRGIGPVFADKISYQGIRIYDLIDKKQFSEKLKVQLSLKNKIIKSLGGKVLSQKSIENDFFKMREKILGFVKELYPEMQNALKNNKNILLVGVQGMLLDNDWGTYPFVTASNILPGAINAGSGINPAKIKNSIGIAKAYTTRVGAGPFPTELDDKFGKKLQIDSAGTEVGATTGRSRRTGWFDAEVVRFAAQISGFTEIALTKIDVLDDFSEIKICTGYELNGKSVNYFDGDAEFLKKVKPVYKTLKGWKSKTRGMTKYADLPENAKKYVAEIEKQIGVKIKYISTGPDSSEIIIR